MATQANEATGKAGTPTRSSVSLLRGEAPQIRTAEAVMTKFEQIQDGLERQSITPKTAEQMNQTLKGIMNLEKLAMQYWSLALKSRKGGSGSGAGAPVPRTPIMRSILGLPDKLSASDGQAVKELVG